MARRYVFADEAGDFEFVRKARVSRYFIVCVVSCDSCDIGVELLKLRRELIWERQQKLGTYFHASEDRQAVRDRVFDIIRNSPLRIWAQIMEKSKAQPQLRQTKERFYQHGWFYLFKFISRSLVQRDTELMVTAASVGIKKGQTAFTAAVHDVLSQTIPREQWVMAFCPAQADPCVQVADYCTWAIQRKWELGDTRSYDLIRRQIAHEYDFFERGNTHYY